MQKGTIVEISLIIQCQKYSKEYASDSKITFSPTGNRKNLAQPKTSQKRKRDFFRNFSKKSPVSRIVPKNLRMGPFRVF